VPASAQPVAKGVAAEKERQAGRKSQHQHEPRPFGCPSDAITSRRRRGALTLTTCSSAPRRGQRFHRRHVIDVHCRELPAQPIVGRRPLEEAELLLRVGLRAADDGRPPRVSSSRSSALRISRAACDDRPAAGRRAAPPEAVAAIRSPGTILPQKDDVVLPLPRGTRES